MQNSRARVLAAFAHEETDRIPVWLGASPSWRARAIRELGLPDDESLSLRVGDDFRRVSAYYAGPPECAPDHDLPPGVTFRSPFGILRHGYEGGQPIFHPLAEAGTVGEVEAYVWPDPSWIDVSTVRAQAQRFGGEFAVLGGDWSPFWHDAIDLLGMSNLMMKMYDSPAIVDAVFDQIVTYYMEVSRQIFEAAADVIDIFFVGNDFGSQFGPLLGKEQFRRFVAPHLKRLIDLGHKYNLHVLLHCCGGFAPLIPTLIDLGLDGLQALQPNCRGMEPAGLKALFGDNLLLMGAIDSQLVIERSPEEVRAETQRILSIMTPGGGYVASPSHDYVLEETPVANVLALYDAVHDYDV